jgi:hypothetical protein
MIKGIIFLLGFLCFCEAKAQNQYFIYIENSTKQTFTINYNGVEYKGVSHITLSKMKPGNHTLIFNVAGSKPFSITPYLQDEDLGFVLQNSNAVWELKNINTQLVLTEAKNGLEKPRQVEKVINNTLEDRSEKLIEVESIKKNEVNEKQTKPIDSLKLQTKPTSTPMLDLVNPTINILKVRKAFESNTKAGIDQIYIVPNRNKLDTVAIYIPAEAKILVETPKVAEAEIKKETENIKVDSDNGASQNCNQILSAQEETSLVNLIKNATNHRQKLLVIKQNLTNQCITIAQAKLIGDLFETDEERVDFFKSIKNNLTKSSLYKNLEDNIVSDKWKAIFKESINN